MVGCSTRRQLMEAFPWSRLEKHQILELVEILLHHYLSSDPLASQYPATSPGTATARGPSAESEGLPANMSTEEKRGAVSRAFRQIEDPSDLGGQI